MRSLKIIVPGIFLLTLLGGCTAAAPISDPANTNPEIPPIPSITGVPTPVQSTAALPSRPTSTTAPIMPEVTALQNQEPDDITQYHLSAILDYAKHTLAVEQRIDYTNRTSQAIPELLLVVEPMRYPDVFHLKAMTWGDGSAISDFNREIGLLKIPLGSELPPGEKATLHLSYDLRLPSPDPSYYGRPVPFGYSSRQTNLVDWYPFLPPFDPEKGWLVNNAGAFGEHLVYETADFTVQIQISDSNPDLVIAASAPAEVDGERHQYHLPKARNFAWSVSDQYILSTTTVEGIVVLAYSFPFNTEAGEAVLRTTAEALELYTRLFGPYQHQTLSVVEADFLDGMEYDGLYFLSKGFYNLYSGNEGDYLTAIAAHETAHQWWYGVIGSNQALEPWLDEALCTFSELLFYENLHPEYLDWWWTYRIYYYEPDGWVDGSIYNPAGYLAYRNAIYLNGALFLEELRNLVEEQPFSDFMQAYVESYRYQVATADDFFELLAKFNPNDLTPLLDKYFLNR
jgi:hypothetical protein